MAGPYTAQELNANNCYDTYHLALTVNPVNTFNENHTICQGETYQWHGQNLTLAGPYTAQELNAGNCYDTYHLTLTVNPVNTFNETHTICQGETYVWHGQNLTLAGPYTAQETNANGCTDTYHLTLTVNPVNTFNENHTICQGETYVWHGQNLTLAGPYTAQELNANNCYDTYNLTLTVNPVNIFNENHTICQGETYVWHGQNLTLAGPYTAQELNAGNCYDTYKLTLTVNPVNTFNENHTICQGETYQWHGQNLTLAGPYTAQELNAGNCYDTYHLTLTVNPVNTFNENHTICQGEMYMWHGQHLTIAGPYTAQELNAGNCYDTYNLTLTVNPVNTFNEDHSICQGETYVWHGQNLTVAGPYTAQELNANNCYDTYNLTLTVKPVLTFNDTHTICQGETYVWHGQNLTIAGPYTAQEINAFGCVENYNLTLTVNPVFTFNETHTICQGETYVWHGQNLTLAGPYTAQELNATNCYDTYKLTLTVNPVNTYFETHSICQGETYVWHGQNLTIAGPYTAQELNANNCYDNYNLTLTVNPVNTFNETHTICQGDVYVWHGQNLTVAGPYTAQELNAYNCNDTYNLTLTVNPVSTFNENHTICQGETYVWHGQNLTIAGPYTAQETNTFGCLETYNLTLTVNPVNTFNETHTICQGEIYQWHGQILTVAGPYTAQELNATNCYDTYKLTLTVNPVNTFNENHTICQGETYVWHGQNLTLAGPYTAQELNANNCYDTYNLTLTVNPVNTFNENHAICQGETYVWHGQNLTVAGPYTAQVLNANNCYDTYNLTLTVNPLVSPTVTIAASANPVVAGTSVTITPTVQAGYTVIPLGISWYVNNDYYSSGMTLTYVPSNGDQIYGAVQFNEGCTIQVGTNLITMNVTAPVATVTGGGVYCPTGAPVAIGLSTSQIGFSYQFKKNGVNFGSAMPGTGAALAISTTQAGTYTCFSGAVAMNGSAVVTTTNPVAPSVSLYSDVTTICRGAAVNFTTTPVNPGATPSFDWYVNGVVQGSHAGTLQIFPTGNPTSVYCKMTSSAGCVTTNPVTSNTKVITVNQILTPSVSIAANNLNVCAGSAITYTATPVNGGSAPYYTWYRDGVALFGGTSATVNIGVSAASSVYCTMTSNANCISASSVQSNTLMNTVMPVVTPSVSIAADNYAVCAGTAVNFTATSVNGGTASYDWYVGGVLQGGHLATFQYTGGSTTVYCKMTSSVSCPSVNPVTSNTVSITVNPVVTPTVAISANVTTVCSGTTVSFTAVANNAGNTASYDWYVGGVLQATHTASLQIAPVANVAVYCKMTSSIVCVSANPVTSNTVNITVNPIVTPTVSIVADNLIVCAGTAIQYTATPVNGGSAPTYNWYRDGILLFGGTAATVSIQANAASSVYCKLISNASCTSTNSATSNTLVNAVNPVLTASVTIVADNQAVCAGAVITFTATPVNGGTPAYNWYVGGILQATHLATLQVIANAASNVYCTMTSSLACTSVATSNTLAYTITTVTTPSVSITSDAITACEGATHITFTAAPVNGGSTPFYNWHACDYIGGVITHDTIFFGGTLNVVPVWTSISGRSIYCTMTSNALCNSLGATNQATSNIITYSVNPTVIPTIAIIADNQAVCSGSPITLTATISNGGSTPNFDWYVGGVLQASHSNPFIYTGPSASVYCKLTSNALCATPSVVQSNTIGLTVNSSSVATVSIIADNSTVCAGTTINFTATPTNGGINPVYNWYRGGVLLSGGTSTTFAVGTSASSNVYCKMTSNLNCVVAATVTSNTINYTVNPIVTPTVIIAASANPVNSGTAVTFTPTVQAGYTVATYSWYKNGSLVSSAATYNYTPVNGDQVYVVLTFNESCTATSTSNTVTMTVSTITGPPVVSTYGVTNNIYTGVTLNGSVDNNGGDVTVERGFIYSTNAAPTALNGTVVTASTSGAGTYSKVIVGLTPNTYYYVKAYAKNALGIYAYGAVKAFDTRNIDVFTGVGNWSNAARWSNGVPTSTSSVFIQGTCTVDANGDCYSLGVYPTASITIPVGFTINANAYALVYSDATGTGAIVQLGTLNVLTANASQFQRYVTVGGPYHFVSSPLSLATSYQFTNGSGGATLASLTEATGLFSNVVVNSYLPIGKGYKLTSPTKSLFTMSGGVFNKGDKTIALSYTAGHGTNLVGNPYPCRLDLHGSNLWTSNNISSTISTWNPTIGNYDTWNGVIGTNMLSSGFLAETQGFQVLATGAAPSITIPEIAQSAQYSNNFKNVVPNLVRLNISGNNSSDEMVVYFDQNATSGLDHQFDAEKEYGNIDAPQLFSITSNDVLSINCLPEVNSNVTVPVGLKVGVNTSYTITASDIESFNAGTNVYLEDLKLNKMINLNEKATYTFDANTNDVVNRFMLHFGNPTSTNSTVTLNSYSFDNTIYVNNPSLVNINEVVVYNALGQVVASFKPEITSLKGYSINAVAGSYIVKIVTDNNVVSNKVNLK